MSITENNNILGFCGHNCTSCKQYTIGKCPGCAKNDAATWCKIRQCCIANNYTSCADCNQIH